LVVPSLPPDAGSLDSGSGLPAFPPCGSTSGPLTWRPGILPGAPPVLGRIEEMTPDFSGSPVVGQVRISVRSPSFAGQKLSGGHKKGLMKE